MSLDLIVKEKRKTNNNTVKTIIHISVPSPFSAAMLTLPLHLWVGPKVGGLMPVLRGILMQNL